MESLGEKYPKEQARLRELLGRYKEIGPSGSFGAMMSDAAASQGRRGGGQRVLDRKEREAKAE